MFYDTSIPFLNSLSGTANLDRLSYLVHCFISLRTGRYLVRLALLWHSPVVVYVLVGNDFTDENKLFF